MNEDIRNKFNELIDKMPIELIAPFYRMGCYYLGYTTARDNKATLRNQYIINTNKAIMIMDMICNMCSDGEPLEDRANYSFDKEKSEAEINKAYKFITENSDILTQSENESKEAEIDVSDISVEISEQPESAEPNTETTEHIESEQIKMPENVDELIEADMAFDQKLRENDKDYSVKKKLNDLMDNVKAIHEESSDKKVPWSESDYIDILNGNFSDYDLDKADNSKLMETQLNMWGMKPTYVSSQAIMKLFEIYKDKDAEYIKSLTCDDILLAMARATNKIVPSIITGLRYLLGHAKFDNGKMIPILSKMSKKDLTVEFFINQLKDFIIH